METKTTFWINNKVVENNIRFGYLSIKIYIFYFENMNGFQIRFN